jgi:hypothetical protein
VQRATDGIPRLVNQLCDHALILAQTAGVTHVDATRIEEAWADLQQLPPPYTGSSEVEESGEATIEFGSLDDLVDEDSEEIVSQETDHAESVPFVTRFDDAQYTPNEHEAPAASSAMDNEIERAARQLDQIDARIAQLNSDNVDAIVKENEVEDQVFQPLGSFQQEVEFDVAATPDLFSESYDEEEVIIDRYAAMSGSLAGRPQVYSTEGRAIADALAPHDVQPPSPRLATVEEAEPHTPDEPVEEFQPEEMTVEIEQPHVEVEPEPISSESINLEPICEAPCDTPLVVIEEDMVEEHHAPESTPATEETAVEETVVEPEPPVSVVEPNQFGSLFTNLRRNTGS